MYHDNELKLFSPQHQSHYFGAIKMFIDNPVFGVGPKLFRFFCDDEKYNIDMYTCSTHPHNTYIQILAEIGIVGFILICIPLIFVFYQLSRKFIHTFVGSKSDISNYQACLLICFLVSLWPFIPTQAFFNNWISIIYFLPVGFYLHSIYTKKS
jgi:O-antigen ligase